MDDIPLDEYERYAQQFTAERYRPEEWVQIAKDAGMKYMVLTTRHHDGYCLFETETTDFTAPDTGPGRDLVAEYVEACHEADMGCGLYYSLIDWRYPASWRPGYDNPGELSEFVDMMHTQVRELMTNYGDIDILWYDGDWPHTAEEWRSEELNAMARELQPHIMINNRAATEEDFGTPEMKVEAAEEGRLWEACLTMNDWWGWAKGDHNWKSTRFIIQSLLRSVHGGGNVLLNVGPKPDGTFPHECVQRLQQVGGWLDDYGEAVYGTERSPIGRHPIGLPTCKGTTLYEHVLRWPGSEVIFAGIETECVSASLLPDAEPVEFTQKGPRIICTGLPEHAPNIYSSVIKLEFAEKPEPWDLMHERWWPSADMTG